METKIYLMDTESCGFTGATILIQYKIRGNDNIIVHNIFKETIESTLRLLNEMVDGFVIGFNLAHDYYHLAQTLNVMSLMRLEYGSQLIPNSEYYEYVITKYSRDPRLDEPSYRTLYDLCFNPIKSLDLMMYGRESVFQSTMNQSPIVLKKIPTLIADQLIEYLEDNLYIDPIYFSRRDGKPEWKTKVLHKETGKECTPEELSKNKKDPEKYLLDIDENFVNLVLNFFPSTSLKNISKHILGLDTKEFTATVPKPKEIGSNPTGGDYYIKDENGRSKLDYWIDMWDDPQQLEYARNDIVFTEGIYDYFLENQENEDELYEYDYPNNLHAILDFNPLNSELAGMVGNLYWTGFSIDKELVKKLYKVTLKKSIDNQEKIAFNSPTKVLAWLHEVADPFQQALVQSTDKETLKALIGLKDEETGKVLPISERARIVYDARRNELEKGLLEKLWIKGRFHATYKVLGTKTNRMSGGSLTKANGSINPQGIKKDSDIRKVFTFKDKGQYLSGGDFAGFEISIMEAVYNDEKLRADLLGGKKIHAIWGSYLYKMTYDEIFATSEINAEQPDGYYSRAKNSLFASLYGGQAPKIAEITGLSVEDIELANLHLEEEYPKIAEAKNSVIEDFSCMVQAGGIGSKIVWREPKEYVESFLGFKRYFKMEYEVIRTLFGLGSDLPKEFNVKGVKIMRRDRLQTVSGAVRSAIYAGAFNLQSSIIRTAGNHKIQSAGGQMTKELQLKFWELQPKGCERYQVKPQNFHDEIMVTHIPELVDKIVGIKDEYINYRRDLVPLLAMDWKSNGKNWKEVH